ncbi:hypothetical protein IP76_18480 [Rhizobium sp. AAP43]|nr:hypothetical protein IP76_18480 [Rhizobium sp. AAP43]
MSDPQDPSVSPQILQALQRVKAKRQQSPTSPTPQTTPQEEPGMLSQAADFVGRGLQQTRATLGSVSTGAIKSAFEVSDFAHEMAGDPVQPEEWSGFRQTIEAQDKFYADLYAPAAIVSDISQFATGMVGAGKVMGLSKTVAKLKQGATLARGTYETARGAATGFIAIDPHEDRLSNLIQQYPALENPVTEYLAASPDDEAMEGRLKNALEGIGLDVAIAGTFATALKAMRYIRQGDDEAAEVTLKAMDESSTQEAQPPAVKEQLPEAPEQTAPAQAANPAPDGTQPPAIDPMSQPEAAKTPAAAPVVQTRIEDEDVSAIIKGAEDDLSAIRLYGSREEATAQGHRFTSKGYLPWQKLQGPEEVRTLVDNTATALKARLGELKGGDVLSDPKVREMVRERASMFNEDTDLLMGQLIKAGDNAKSMVADMEASYLIANKMFQDAYAVATKIQSGILTDWAGDATKAGEELKRRLAVATELMGSAKSMSSAAGRSLRRMRSEFQVSPEDMALLKDMDPQKLASLVYASKGEPKKLAEFAKPTFLRRAMEEGQYSLVNSLLWLYPTHLVNVTTNAFMLAARPTERWLGGLALGAKGSPIRHQAAKEYGYMLGSLGDGFSAMLEAFKRGDSRLHPHHSSEFFSEGASGVQQGALNFKPLTSLENIIHNGMIAANYRNVVGLPTRALGAIDEFMKTLSYRATVQSKAYVEATQRGLSGQDLAQFIERRLSAAFDDSGRGTDLAALKEAQTATFQQDLLKDTFGRTVQNARTKHPVLGFVLPFVKTPINVLRYSHKMTPGLNLLQKEYRQMLTGQLGTEQQAQAIGQMTLGATFMALIAVHAANGGITGGGPDDPALRGQLEATGWKPYSIVWEGADGKRRFLPLGKFDPVGLPASIVVDIVEGRKLNEDDKSWDAAAGAALLSIGQRFSDRTFLFNIESFLRALKDPEQHGGKYLGQTAANMIPLSSALRGYVNDDPYMREARSFTDYLRKDMPGLSAALPPRRDAFGEPIFRRIGLTSTDEADTVEAEQNRIILDTGKGLGAPDPMKGDVDLRDFKLSNGRTAYDLYQEYMAEPPGRPSLKTTLAKLIKSDLYQDLPDGPGDIKGTRLNALLGVVGKYREAAYKRLLIEHPELSKETLRRKAQVAADLKSNRTDDPGAGRKLLERLGY